MLETQTKKTVFCCSEGKCREGIAWDNVKGW